MTTGSASDTFQRGVQNLQAWLDYLDKEEGDKNWKEKI